MSDAILQVDQSTLQTAERIARERECSIEEVVRNAISEYGGTQVNGTPLPSQEPTVEPDSELAVTIPMPFPSRPVTIGIVNRSTLAPKPILPEFEEGS